MRLSTMAWLSAFALAACGAPTPGEGDRCDQGAKPICKSGTERLVCNGAWLIERCRGPAGCASDPAGATCDQSLVVAGDRCNQATDTFACQADPPALMECRAVWTSKKGCAAGCVVQADGGPACAAVDGGEPLDAGPLYPTVQNGSGPLMVNPRWVSVTFSNDTPAMVQAADDFVNTLGSTSNFWTPLAMEYGLGVPTAAPPVHLAEAAPASITDSGDRDLAGLEGRHPRGRLRQRRQQHAGHRLLPGDHRHRRPRRRRLQHVPRLPLRARRRPAACPTR